MIDLVILMVIIFQKKFYVISKNFVSIAWAEIIIEITVNFTILLNQLIFKFTFITFPSIDARVVELTNIFFRFSHLFIHLHAYIYCNGNRKNWSVESPSIQKTSQFNKSLLLLTRLCHLKTLMIRSFTYTHILWPSRRLKQMTNQSLYIYII